MQYNVKNLKSPIGTLTLVANESSIMGVCIGDFDPNDYSEFEFNSKISVALLKNAATQLHEYFKGDRQKFNLPLEFKGTEFQKKVWRTLQKIPYNKTWSYQTLAAKINNPKAVRAVGSANGKNPLCILIPCHRVIRHNGELGGYTGGVVIKQKLLDLEMLNHH